MVYHRSSESGGSSKRPVNTFANDGSFMEMFKKLQEQQGSQSSSSEGPSESGGNKTSDDPSTKTEPKEGDTKAESSSSIESKPASGSRPVFVGKRRGGRFLATGKVKKLKAGGQDEEEAPPKDAWSLYLAEVKKYKQTTCEEEGKTRPLVK